jgi:hypothetical protein
LKGEGRFGGETISTSEYGANKIGDRYDASKPTVSEIWAHGKDKFVDSTVSGGDYVAHNVDGRRTSVNRPKDSNVLKGEGRFDSETVNNTDYVATKGDRYDVKRPENNEIFARDGGVSSFAHRMGEKAPPQAVKGERFEVIFLVIICVENIDKYSI